MKSRWWTKKSVASEKCRKRWNRIEP